MLEIYGLLKRIADRFHRDESGATAIEYGLLAAGISVVIIATVFLLGDVIQGAFEDVMTAIQGGGGGTP